MKTKKFASLFLATTLLTGILAGCSGGEDESTSSVKVEIRLKLV